MNVNTVDKHVGQQLKIRRSLLGISQHKIGVMTGVTFQQIQKYEKGSNRISCSRLFEFAKILSVPIEYFFDGLSKSTSLNNSIFRDNEDTFSYSGSNVEEREILSLIKYFTKIKDKNTRKSVLNLAKSLSKEQDSNENEIKVEN